LLKFRALPLLLKPPNALPREVAGWAERLKAGLGRFGDGLGRLIVGVRAADRVAGVAWELQPRDSRLRAEARAPGEPLVRKRLWSGCHFCAGRLTLLIVLWLLLMFTFRLMSMSTSLWW
jgi:hypothetical protein